jgi:AraC family transcriptional regulator of adaptative response/methylated-DNA-[protein]-cysteine methyltransferase
MLSEDLCWQAVAERDRRSDGAFVYAVRTTGIFCRPSCPARRPQRERVAFFPAPEEAARAGFRPCLRCRPTEVDAQAALTAHVCALIAERPDAPPTLAELGEAVAVSPFHLQRVFRRAMGVSPRQYAEALRLERLRGALREEATVTEAVYAAGYGSGSRVYEQAPERLGMTPRTYRAGGEGEIVRYTVVPCPLGLLLLAATERGVCAVTLGDDAETLASRLAEELPAAKLTRDDDGLRAWAEAAVRHLEGREPLLELPLDLRATAFQRQVWDALRAIPYGTTQTYRQVAERLGRPTATRAVAGACAANPVALVVPCHRVVREDGGLGGYRWGVERKRAILEREREVV